MFSEYTSALPLLLQAMDDLSLGQVIADERYGMMDLMSAIEINDARTDTYLSAREKQRDDLPPFDPARELSVQEVVWLVDEVARLEAAFHDGHPLSSTLWTCNYLRPASLHALAFAPSSSSSSSPDPARPEELRRVVLRALLLGVLKCSEIVWEELCKGNVYEHEDVHLSLSSLSFPSLLASLFPPLPPPPPPRPDPLAIPGQTALTQQPQEPQERQIGVDEVLRALEGAEGWVRERAEQEGEEGEEQGAWEALLVRLRMRIDLLYPLALLTAPSRTSPSAVLQHLTRLDSYSALLPPSSPALPAFTPPPALLAALSPSPSVPLLATPLPPRPVIVPTVGEAYEQLVKRFVRDVQGLVELWSEWAGGLGKEGSWEGLREYCKKSAGEGKGPYVRSLHMSLIAPTSQLFSLHPSLTLTAHFLSTLLPSLPSALFSPLGPLAFLRSRESSPSAPAHQTLAWAERLAASFLVPTTAGLAAQNRGRQRRIVVKTLRQGEVDELVREAREGAVPVLCGLVGQLGEAAFQGREKEEVERAVSRVPVAVAVHGIELALEALLASFEGDSVGLVDAQREDERREGWFVVGAVAGRLERVWEGLIEREEGAEGGDAHRPSRRQSTLLHPASKPLKFSSPFLPSASSSSSLAFPPAADSLAAARGRFMQRYDWLEGLPEVGGGEGGREGGEEWDWEAYRRAVWDFEALSPQDRRNAILSAFRSANTALDSPAVAALPSTAREGLRKLSEGLEERVRRLEESGKEEARVEGAVQP
ncbi:hypothetical protein JCM8097_005825 [Rhodosporidiobolus ruineniae]